MSAGLERRVKLMAANACPNLLKSAPATIKEIESDLRETSEERCCNRGTQTCLLRNITSDVFNFAKPIYKSNSKA